MASYLFINSQFREKGLVIERLTLSIEQLTLSLWIGLAIMKVKYN